MGGRPSIMMRASPCTRMPIARSRSPPLRADTLRRSFRSARLTRSGSLPTGAAQRTAARANRHRKVVLTEDSLVITFVNAALSQSVGRKEAIKPKTPPLSSLVREPARRR